MTIYADILIITNYIINYLLLSACAKLTGREVVPKRVLLSAFLGALSSLLIFANIPYAYLWVIIRIAVSILMVAVAFKFISFFQTAKQLFVFLTVSFLFAGVLNAVYINTPPNILTVYNGVVYFNISALSLIICTTIAYIIISFANRIYIKLNSCQLIYKLFVTIDGNTAEINALLDTGSSAADVFSDTPAIICSKHSIEKIMPPDLLNLINNYLSCGQSIYGFRLIPCTTAAGNSLLPAFKADSVKISTAAESFVAENVYIAVSAQPIKGRYNALIPPQIMLIKDKRHSHTGG